MDLTPNVLQRCMPQAPSPECVRWAPAFDAAAKEFGITDPDVLAAWLASMANESGQLHEFRELWRYSPERAAEIYGLTAEQTAQYQQSRETWFEFVYGHDTPRGRMLGNNLPGDGGKYYGLGPGQITGKNNVRAVSAATGVDFLAHPEKLCDPVDGARAFAAFFAINHIGEMAADGTEAGFLRAMRAMNPGLPESEFAANHLVRWHEVRFGLGIEMDLRFVQGHLLSAGFDPHGIDGIMGPGTRAALRAYQEANGLPATGRPDAATLAALGLVRPGLVA